MRDPWDEDDFFGGEPPTRSWVKSYIGGMKHRQFLDTISADVR